MSGGLGLDGAPTSIAGAGASSGGTVTGIGGAQAIGFGMPVVYNDAPHDLLYPVGTMPGCQSPLPAYSGVYDMSGNAYEWEDNCELGVGMTAYCIRRGGSFTFWDTQPMCGSTYNAQRSDASFEIGFRCCSQ